MLFKTLLTALIAALEAYTITIQWKRETYLDKIEDEIDKLAPDADNVITKLRIKRLVLRKKRYAEQFGIIRSTTNTPD